MAFFDDDLFRQMEMLRREIDRTLNPSRAGLTSSILPGRVWPPVNISQSEDDLVLDVLAPGLDPESVNVSVAGRQVNIAGERKGLPESVSAESLHRNERGSGSFFRTIDLETDVDRDRVSAHYRNGLLRVTLPKAEQAKPRRVSIDVG